MKSLFYAIMFTICLLYIKVAVASSALDESLIYHAYFGEGKDVERLLKKGANPNARDEHGWPALAIAADRSDKEAYPIAKALVDAGADVNYGVNGHYPIIGAIHNNNADTVRALLAERVNLAIRDEKGRTIMQLAREASNPLIYYYLSKIKQEEQQLQKFLRSNTHLRQILLQYTFHNCAFQYWAFYLKSQQDKNINEQSLRQRIKEHARIVSDTGTRGASFFPSIYQNSFGTITTETRDSIFNELNSMISNRNRRSQGVGKVTDMKKRCDRITNATLVKTGLAK